MGEEGEGFGKQASSVFHLRMRQIQVIRDKQAISAADITWEQ